MNEVSAFRVALNLSPAEFAARVGIYPDYIKYLEREGRVLNEAWVDAIAGGFGVNREMVLRPAFFEKELSSLTLPPQKSFACPLGVRFAILWLVAKLAGLSNTVDFSEDQLADAVLSFNQFAGDIDQAADAKYRVSRLSKGLQIAVLAIAQSIQLTERDDLEEKLLQLLPRAIALIDDP